MLFPSQQRAADELRQHSGNGAVVLRGLSGMGKSTVAESALQPGVRNIVDVARARKDIAQLRQALAQGIRTILLAQPHDNPQDLGVAIHSQEVRLRGLSSQEVHQWLDESHPPLSADERACVEQYGLGVPLVVRRMLSARPLHVAAARMLCASYLQSVIDQMCVSGTDFATDLEHIIRQETSANHIPADVLPLLGPGGLRHTTKPLQLLNQRLTPERSMPLPQSEQLLKLYERWLAEHPDEPAFDVFIDHMEAPEPFLDALGYSDNVDRRTSLLGAFAWADSRKGAVCAPDSRGPEMRYQLNNAGETSVDWMNSRLLELARASDFQAAPIKMQSPFGGEQIAISVPGLSAPLYIHKHDHTQPVVMPVAYTIECELQRRGLAYSMRLGDRSYRYDPATRTYRELPVLNVKYYHEAHGWPLDDEEG